FDGRYMVLDLTADKLAVSHAAPPAVLLVDPESDADGAPRFETEFLHEGHGLEAGDDGSAIVLRALADVPGIEVAAQDDHFLGMLPAGDLADDVAAIGVGGHLRAHLQVDRDGHAVVDKTGHIMASSGERAAAGIFG